MRGSHQFNFGGNVIPPLLNAISYAWSQGFFVFAGIFGTPLIDFLTGNVANLHQANPNPDNVTQNFLGLYASDTWKANRTLTVYYGVRWNPFFPMEFKHCDTYNFSLSNFYNDVRSTVVPTAPPGFLYVGDPGVNAKSGMNNQWDTWSRGWGLPGIRPAAGRRLSARAPESLMISSAWISTRTLLRSRRSGSQ